jgi:DNA gyrase subunit A
MHIFFATAKGNVRRNDLSDFHDIRTSGKIAIRLDEGDRLIGVQTCRESDHVLLAARSGKCIRFQVSDVRVFKSRTSDGVRGMKLTDGDDVVSMSVLGGIDTTVEERYSYLKMAATKRRALGVADAEETINVSGGHDEEIKEVALSDERFRQMEAAEQFILTVTENGYGKRSSAYEYRTTGRGGSGIVNIITSPRNGKVVSSQPVDHIGQVMLMTDRATVIRCPLDDIRIAGRNTQGVTILKTQPGEKVVSVVKVPEGEAVEEEGMSGDEQG